jgi:hypothetical protein
MREREIKKNIFKFDRKLEKIKCCGFGVREKEQLKRIFQLSDDTSMHRIKAFFNSKVFFYK